MADRVKKKRPRDERLPSPTAVSLPPPRKPLPPHRLVLAPMVGGSELAFRLLARRHGAQLCYTPMIKSEEFSNKGAGVALLERHAEDAPLVAHFSGNDPVKLLAAARRAERCAGVEAIDLNLGCPQRSAHSGHFGAFLLDPPDRPLVLRIVSTLSRALRVPMFCKIRLLDELPDTLSFVQQLQDAGCALLTVHGRYRGSPMRRRDGPAHLDQIKLVKELLTIPVLTNGNVRDASELLASLELTGADGVMSAEGALDDPAIFGRAIAAAHEERRQLKKQIRSAKAMRAEKRSTGRKLSPEEKALLAGRKAARARLLQLNQLPTSDGGSDGESGGSSATIPSSPLDLAEQYLELVRAHPPPGGRDALMTHTIFHLRRLARALLTKYELLPSLMACTSLEAAADVVCRCRAYESGELTFEPGAEAERKVLEDGEARAAANSARRAEFVERMTAKARKDGKPDDFYLRVGREPPTAADVAAARRIGEKDSKALTRWWRERFGQHCQGFYLDGACPHLADARGCGFLHAEQS